MSRDRRWALALLVLGSLQMVGDLLDVPVLVGLGAASHVSPAPKVFTRVGDAEPFSATYALELELAGGRTHTLPLDRTHYARLRGPYNRRNVIGAVVAGGPHLGESETLGPMMRAAAATALCGGAVLRELDPEVDRAVVRATIVQTSRDGQVHRWAVPC